MRHRTTRRRALAPQMLKAFTPTVTLIMLWATGIEVPSRPVLLAVLGICGGTAMASLGEGSFHILGLSLCARVPSIPPARVPPSAGSLRLAGCRLRSC